MQAFVPKNRRPRFELVVRILDLNNVPLSSGTAYVKWSLPSSAATEHRGVTDKAIIIDHRAYWSYEKLLLVRLTIDRNQSLHQCDLVLDVVQEFGSGGRGDKNLLGRIRLNLAEYVDKSDEEEGITRRYLMQDSKINSTLKVTVIMRQLEGDKNYTIPPLKSPMVFSGINGITGVVFSEQGDPADSLGRFPSLNTKSREVSDMQDMYRRTLIASWNSPVNEIPADKLIEELFAGGSGWNKGSHSRKSEENEDALGLFPNIDMDSRQFLSGTKLSPSLEKRPRSSSSHQSRFLGKEAELSSSPGHAKKTRSIEQKLIDSAKGKGERRSGPSHEVSEFDVREDLRSWEISPR